MAQYYDAVLFNAANKWLTAHGYPTATTLKEAEEYMNETYAPTLGWLLFKDDWNYGRL